MSISKAPRWLRARADDSALLLRWRNDPLTRRNSLDTARVPRAEHEAWLSRRLRDRRCRLWLAFDSRKRPVGQLRLDWSRGGATVSITVAPRRRGEGWAAAMLRAIPKPHPALLRATVKADNVASAAAFLKAGFRFRRAARANGVVVYFFEKRGAPRA